MLARPAHGRVAKVFWALCWLTVLFYGFVIVSLAALRWADPPLTAVQAENFVLHLLEGRDDPYRRTAIPLSAIPLETRRAVVAAEDYFFHEHYGFDFTELGRAVRAAFEGRGLRGGSTITQQLIKNLYLTNTRVPSRKLVEYSIVPLAELILGKDRILELYLNVIEWGPNVWGIEAGARHHYGLSAAELSREQAARLAACIPSPRKRRPAQMNRASASILERMRSHGW